MNSKTSLVAKQYHLQEWTMQIKDCQNRPKNMTVEEWCNQNGLTKPDYYYRMHRVRKADFKRNLIILQVTKKYKQRLVPFEEDLAKMIHLYCIAMGILNVLETWFGNNQKIEIKKSVDDIPDFLRKK